MNLAESIQEGAAPLGVDLTPQALHGLVAYAEAFLAHGRDRGVTALAEPAEVVRELLLDSLAAAPHLPHGARVADLGSGGGVPGIPLALVRPDLRVLLVESLNRKSEWLREQVEALGLGDRVQVHQVRAEDLGRQVGVRGELEAVVAKALAALPVLVELALPLLRVGGCLYAFKGPSLPEELARSRKALAELRARHREDIPYRLEDRERVLCVVEKLGATPEKYPRRAGVPERKPL